MVDPSVTERIEHSSRGIGSLEITAVEPVVTRTPTSTAPSDEFIEMPPIGFMSNRVGIGKRLDHASPSRFKGHSQTVLVKITTDQGLIGWGEAHAPARQGDHGSVGADPDWPGRAEHRAAVGKNVFQPAAQGLCHGFLH